MHEFNPILSADHSRFMGGGVVVDGQPGSGKTHAVEQWVRALTGTADVLRASESDVHFVLAEAEALLRVRLKSMSASFHPFVVVVDGVGSALQDPETRDAAMRLFLRGHETDLALVLIAQQPSDVPQVFRDAAAVAVDFGSGDVPGAFHAERYGRTLEGRTRP